ncbi:hypothetical protein Efla_007119 [Eimeria flavescens]
MAAPASYFLLPPSLSGNGGPLKGGPYCRMVFLGLVLVVVFSVGVSTAEAPAGPQGAPERPPIAAALALIEEALAGAPQGEPPPRPGAAVGSSTKSSSKSSSSGSSPGEAPYDRFARAAPPLSFRDPLSLLPAKSSSHFSKLAACADTDPRCQYELSLFYLLGRPPLWGRCLLSALQLLWLSARGGSADAQYLLGILHQNLYLLPHEPPLIELERPLRVIVNSDHSLSFVSGDRPVPAPWGPLKPLKAFWRNLRQRADAEGLGFRVWDFAKKALGWLTGEQTGRERGSPAAAETERPDKQEGAPEEKAPQTAAPQTAAEAMDVLLSAPDFALNPPLPLVYIHAAAVAQHPAAAAAAAWRQQLAAFEGSVGQQQQACAAAANHYLPVAKSTAGVYAAGIPQAVEVLRLSGGLGFSEEDEFYRLSGDPEHLTMLVHEAKEGNLAVHALLGRKFLFGVDGFPQDFAKARYHLLAASRSSKGEAKSLLGYIYALGLGVEADLNEAAEWFFRGAKENQDPIAFNGLGLVYFFGTPLIDANPALAFEMFNKSATLNSPDGQLNLASLYLTGTGVSKSFVEALRWLTKAVRGGSTGAAYALGVMHLSGLGAVRDCPLAVGLLKLATERASFFAHTLQRAHTAYERSAFDEAAFHYLLLAEAGHEAAQYNLAFLLDAGLTDIFFDGTLRRKRLHAQRFYEMAAAQGSLAAQLRLGDFAYYGFGVRRRSELSKYPKDFYDESGVSFEGWLMKEKAWMEEGEKDFAEAAAFYRKVADSAAWGPALAAKARYNLGAMHLFGTGVPKDLFLASSHFNRSLEADEHAPTAPVYAGLAAVYVMDFFERVGPAELVEALLEEPRILLLLLNLYMRQEGARATGDLRPSHPQTPGAAAEARYRQLQQQRQQQQQQQHQQEHEVQQDVAHLKTQQLSDSQKQQQQRGQQQQQEGEMQQQQQQQRVDDEAQQPQQQTGLLPRHSSAEERLRGGRPGAPEVAYGGLPRSSAASPTESGGVSADGSHNSSSSNSSSSSSAMEKPSAANAPESFLGFDDNNSNSSSSGSSNHSREVEEHSSSPGVEEATRPSSAASEGWCPQEGRDTHPAS